MVDVRRHPPLALNRSSRVSSSSRQRWTTCGLILIIISYCLGFFSGHYFAQINIDNDCIQSAPPINNIALSTISSATNNDKNNNDINDQQQPIINIINPSTVTCDNCQGIFQYDPPNYSPNASTILSAENVTYSASSNPKFRIFFPKHNHTTNPELCIKEWYENKQKYRGKGMSVWEEDLVIFDAFFKDRSMRNNNSDMFYLEIGAHNGVRSSNTRLFDVCLGWSGILVEPIPR